MFLSVWLYVVVKPNFDCLDLGALAAAVVFGVTSCICIDGTKVLDVVSAGLLGGVDEGAVEDLFPGTGSFVLHREVVSWVSDGESLFDVVKVVFCVCWEIRLLVVLARNLMRAPIEFSAGEAARANSTLSVFGTDDGLRVPLRWSSAFSFLPLLGERIVEECWGAGCSPLSSIDRGER